MTAPSYTPLTHRGVLAAGGADRVAFLQGLLTNDVAKAGPGRALYAGFLTAQGKFLHDLFVAELGERLLLDCESARRAELRVRLLPYRLRAKVELAADDTLAVFALYGDGALAALGLQDEPGRAQPLGGGVVFVDPRLIAAGARAILSKDETATLEKAGFRPAPIETYERHRLTLGLAEGSRDLIVDKALILENGFDEFNGVDWQKGCYVGQEVTARMKYRALSKKRLLPVHLTGPVPAPGTPVLLHPAGGGKPEEAGEMRSATDGIGLALLRLEAVEKAASDPNAALKAGETSIVPASFPESPPDPAIR